MRNRFVRWLKGVAPKPIGAYWGEAGICLVQQNAEGLRRCVYQPLSADNAEPALSIAVEKLVSYGDGARQDFSLAVAINADDVFVRPLTVPAGLSDPQLEQVAIIEAVANLPVPPEEICLDFIRGDESPAGHDESIRLAFCRRDRIDEILALAEGVPVSVSVVDRDVQALHDAVIKRRHVCERDDWIDYPFAIVLTEINPRVVICLDELSFETYPISLPASEPPDALEALRLQLSHCWTRCRMVHGDDALSLAWLTGIGMSLPEANFWLHGINSVANPEVCQLGMSDLRALVPSGDVLPPDEVLLIAAGMTGRELR